MITLQSKLDGFSDDVQSIDEQKPSVIQFPCTGYLSLGQAAGIFKYHLADETVPIWAKVLAIEKIAALETLNGVTKNELQHALQWLFQHYQFDV